VIGVKANPHVPVNCVAGSELAITRLAAGLLRIVKKADDRENVSFTEVGKFIGMVGVVYAGQPTR